MVNLLLGLILSVSVLTDNEEIKIPNSVGVEYTFIVPKLVAFNPPTALESEAVLIDTSTSLTVKVVIPRSDAERPDT